MKFFLSNMSMVDSTGNSNRIRLIITLPILITLAFLAYFGTDNTLKRINKNIPSQQHTALRVLRLKDDNSTVLNEEDTSYTIPTNNNSLFEGDIIPTWDVISKNYGVELANALVKAGKMEKPTISVQGFSPNTGLWNSDRRKGICWIPVYISRNYQSKTVNTIKEALRDLAIKTGVIYFNFIEKKNGGKPFLILQETAGQYCSSYIGRQSTRGQGQIVNLQENSCISKRIVQHEVMHALGFFHEHTRQDRDKYVQVIKINIEQYDFHNF